MVAVDQTELPTVRHTPRLTTMNKVINAIRSLAVRSAPTIGAVGGLAVSCPRANTVLITMPC